MRPWVLLAPFLSSSQPLEEEAEGEAGDPVGQQRVGCEWKRGGDLRAENTLNFKTFESCSSRQSNPLIVLPEQSWFNLQGITRKHGRANGRPGDFAPSSILLIGCIWKAHVEGLTLNKELTWPTVIYYVSTVFIQVQRDREKSSSVVHTGIFHQGDMAHMGTYQYFSFFIPVVSNFYFS